MISKWIETSCLEIFICKYMIMYHDGTCGAKSNVSNLFYSKKRILFLMTVFIQYMLYVYCMSCPCSKTNKLLLLFFKWCGSSLSLSLVLFLPPFLLFFSSHEEKQEADTGRKDFYSRVWLWDGKTDCVRTKGLFLELVWHRGALPFVFIAFVNWFILICPMYYFT